jgi:hypothetical protein
MKTGILICAAVWIGLLLMGGPTPVPAEQISIKKHYSLLDLTQQGIEIGYSCHERGWTVEHCKTDFVTWMKANHGPDGDR